MVVDTFGDCPLCGHRATPGPPWMLLFDWMFAGYDHDHRVKWRCTTCHDFVVVADPPLALRGDEIDKVERGPMSWAN